MCHLLVIINITLILRYIIIVMALSAGINRDGRSETDKLKMHFTTSLMQ